MSGLVLLKLRDGQWLPMRKKDWAVHPANKPAAVSNRKKPVARRPPRAPSNPLLSDRARKQILGNKGKSK